MRAPYFVGELAWKCEPEDDYTMILDESLGFYDSRGDYAEAPAGMRTDGASVKALLELPVIGWLARKILRGDQFTGPFRWPAVIHDGEYGRAKESRCWPALVSRARADADRRIREGALARYVAIRKVSGTCQCDICVEVHERAPAQPWRAWAVWALLRVAGFKVWMDDSEATRWLAGASASTDTETVS